MQEHSTKSRILDAAQRLLWSNNYGSTSVDAICEEADVRKGSFYYYFNSKEDLAVQVLEDQWNYAVNHLLKPAFENRKSSDKQFRIFFQKLYEQYHLSQRIEGVMHGCPFGNLGGEVTLNNEQMRKKLDEIFDGFHTYFSNSLLKSGKSKEEAHLVADQIISYFEGMMLLAKVRNDASVIQRMTAGALQLIH